jgi:hypothetical protein
MNMRQLKTILGLTILVIMSSCKKDDPITKEDNWCGTVETWSQTVTKDDFVGKWIIWNINYSKGTGNTILYDTSYSVTAPLTLNADGTGIIYTQPLNWSLTTSSNSFPKLTITQLDTLFPFPVGFIHNDTTDIYLQLPPNSRFYGRASKNGTPWEYSDISFGHL